MDYRLEQLRYELREDPSSRNFFKLGEHLRREGELTEAVEVLRSGLEHHPRYVAAWVSLGRALLDSGDSLGASEALNTALELDPENSVAARAAGEAAINNSQWVAAVKALKRARGLSGQDDELDERIAFVEEKLAEIGLLENQGPPARAPEGDVFEAEPEPEIESDPEIEIEFEEEASDDPFSVASAADSGVWDTTDDVFAGASGEEDDGSSEAVDEAGHQPEWEMESSDVLEPPPLPDTDAAVEEEQVFPDVGVETQAIAREDILAATEPFGGASVEAEAGPAESVPEFEPEPAPDLDPFSFSETETEMGDGSVDGIEIEPDPFALSEAQTIPQPVYEPEPELEPELETEPEPELEAEPEPESETELPVDDLPVPTMTLARLAVEQGDLEMAEKTVRRILEREPAHEDALRLLDEITGETPEDVPQIAAEDPSDPRVRALQRWLETVRLTSERLKT